MADKFKTGVVEVEFKKNLPYMDAKGEVIEKLKETPQFKEGDRVKLTFKKAGYLAKDGYCDILTAQRDKVDTKATHSNKKVTKQGS